LFSPDVCFSLDQATGVPPQYPEDPYYQHVEQGKRNPPSEHVLSYISANIFSTIILHAVLNVFLLGLEDPKECIKFPMPIPVFPSYYPHDCIVGRKYLTMQC